MLVTSDDPEVGQVSMAGNPIKLSAFTDPGARPPAPDLDHDRKAILAEIGEPD
jgi:CoA:oxalate CoA-transferase